MGDKFAWYTGRCIRICALVALVHLALPLGAASVPIASAAGRTETAHLAKSNAKSTPKLNRHSSSAVAISKPHYVEFRSRVGAGYGHAYVVFGDQSSRGGIATRHYAGLYPAAEAMLVVGHAMPVPAVTTGHPLDRDESRVTASLRLNLGAEEYARVVAVIRQAQRDKTFWHISLNNCNNFVGNVARGLGLRIPNSTLIMPREYVQELKAINEKATAAERAGAAPSN